MAYFCVPSPAGKEQRRQTETTSPLREHSRKTTIAKLVTACLVWIAIVAYTPHVSADNFSVTTNAHQPFGTDQLQNDNGQSLTDIIPVKCAEHCYLRSVSDACHCTITCGSGEGYSFGCSTSDFHSQLWRPGHREQRGYGEGDREGDDLSHHHLWSRHIDNRSDQFRPGCTIETTVSPAYDNAGNKISSGSVGLTLNVSGKTSLGQTFSGSIYQRSWRRSKHHDIGHPCRVRWQGRHRGDDADADSFQWATPSAYPSRWSWTSMLSVPARLTVFSRLSVISATL